VVWLKSQMLILLLHQLNWKLLLVTFHKLERPSSGRHSCRTISKAAYFPCGCHKFSIIQIVWSKIHC
jgi:hypothetical protein